MTRQRKFCLAVAFLLLPSFPAAQQKPLEIKLTIKYNEHAVPGPDHVTLSSGSYVARVAVRDGKFEVPPEISRAKTWRLAAVVTGSKVQTSDLSQVELAYQDCTLHLADRHFSKDYSFAVPRGAEIRSSCILVLESQNIDPVPILCPTSCQSKP